MRISFRIFTEKDLFFEIIGKQITNIFIIYLEKTEFNVNDCIILLQFLLFGEEIFIAKKAYALIFLIFRMSKYRKCLSWACNSISKDSTVISIDYSINSLLYGWLEDLFIGDMLCKNMAKIKISHFGLWIFVFLVIDWDGILINFQDFMNIGMPIFGKEWDSLRSKFNFTILLLPLQKLFINLYGLVLFVW